MISGFSALYDGFVVPSFPSGARFSTPSDYVVHKKQLLMDKGRARIGGKAVDSGGTKAWEDPSKVLFKFYSNVKRLPTLAEVN